MLSFGCLCVLLGQGYWARQKVGILQTLFLPASVIAGLLGLFFFQVANGMGHPVPVEVSTKTMKSTPAPSCSMFAFNKKRNRRT